LSNVIPHIFQFEEYTLDADRRSLVRDGRHLALRPQAMEVLCYLAKNPGRPISKEELFQEIWQGISVTDDSLVQCIRDIREVLEDRDHRLVKTVPRRGYMFTGPMSGDQRREEDFPTPSLKGANGVLSLPDRPSIAVLPFANMSGDPDQEYFADGMSEDLITELARIRWLFVIARNSSFVYKHRVGDVKQVSRELGVRYVLEGSVRRAGKKLRISAQLIDATTGGHHWAEKYDRAVGDIFAVQDEITRSVAGAIEPRLLAAEGVRATLSRSPGDLGAWELVARAKAHSWRLTRSDYEAAIEPLERAVAAYPDYAPARSLLGFCLVFAAHMGWISRDQGLLPGRQHAIRAIMLDDRDSWGHIALGVCAMMERRTQESLAALHRALKLNPNSATAHAHLSRSFAFAGRVREAIEHGEIAVRLSPLDPEMALFLGGFAIAYFAAGRYARAIEYATEAARLRPGFRGVRRMLCASLAQAGRIDEARSSLATLLREQPELSIEWVKANVPYQTPQLMERYVQGLHKAGLG
jgi:TolB-like protein/tetratricopeptide (TPR) repeat protein